MSRPRKTNLHLPPCVYLKRGVYYRVTRGKWYRIGRTLDDFDTTRLPQRMPLTQHHILKAAYAVLARARHNAKQRKVVGFDLSRDDVHRMLNEAGWCCAVTGMEFSLQVINGRKPFAPSIDRIDCTKGYFLGNCRMVCLAVNYAMNVWGEDVFRRMLTGLRQQSIRHSPTSLGVASQVP